MRRQKTTEDSIDTFVYYLGNGFGMPRHFAKGYTLAFKQFRLLVLHNYIVYLWNTLVNHLILVLILTHFRNSRPEVFCKKVFLEISQNSQENTCVSVSFLIKLRASGRNLYILKYINKASIENW